MTDAEPPASPPSSAPLSSLENALTSEPSSWSSAPGFVRVSQLSPSGLTLLLSASSSMRSLCRGDGNGDAAAGGDDRMKHRVLSTVFYEASTRTACSFQSAALRLGGTFLHIDASSKGGGSSTKKGETLEDTVRCLGCYSDAVVLRHPEEGSVGRVMEAMHAAAASTGGKRVPVINAGDGTGEHPTQALLDLFTVCDELGIPPLSSVSKAFGKKKLVVTLLGDNKHGRTVHSLSELLSRSYNSTLGLDELELRYVNPAGLEMPQYVRDKVSAAGGDGVTQSSPSSLGAALEGCDVLYVTRIQKERFDTPEQYEAVKGSYVVDCALLEDAPKDMIIMHPLPRVDEIATEVDSDERAAYFRQMENGMFVRMALLALMLGKA